MRRAAAALLLAGCASPAPNAPVEPVTTPSAPTPPVADASVEAPQLPPRKRGRKVDVDDAQRTTALAITRALRSVAANTDPRPVERGFAKVTTVQYLTSRRSPDTPLLVESPSMGLHHPPEPAVADEPCKQPLVVGGHVKGVRGFGASLKSTDDAHELSLDGKRPPTVRLPKGESHGACLGPDGTRLWISWSTTTSPPELFSVSLRDGAARPLRSDARPQLAWIGEVAAVRGRVIVVSPGATAGWLPVARALEAAGLAVERRRTAPTEMPGVRVVVGDKTLWLDPPDDAPCSPETVLVGLDAARTEATAERGDCAWTAADGPDHVADAWARIVALAVASTPAPRDP